MKPAEEVARALLQISGDWDDGDCEIRDISKAITNARREGAEDMRERLAVACEERWAGGNLNHSLARDVAEAIRALPLDAMEG